MGSRFDTATGTARGAMRMAGVWLVIFWLVAGVVATGASERLDRDVIGAIRGASASAMPLGGEFAVELMRLITAFGDAAALLTMGLVGGLVLLWRGRKGSALILWVTLLSARCAGAILKALFDRSRPDIGLHLAEATSPSFPSGHALNSSATLLALALFLAANAPRQLRQMVLLGAVSGTVLIGLSRVWLAVHWPSDVLAGWALGLAFALAGWAADSAVRRRQGR